MQKGRERGKVTDVGRTKVEVTFYVIRVSEALQRTNYCISLLGGV